MSPSNINFLGRGSVALVNLMAAKHMLGDVWDHVGACVSYDPWAFAHCVDKFPQAMATGLIVETWFGGAAAVGVIALVGYEVVSRVHRRSRHEREHGSPDVQNASQQSEPLQEPMLKDANRSPPTFVARLIRALKAFEDNGVL